MALTDKHAVILAADLFEDAELLYPLWRLREEEIETTLAGITVDPVTGKKGHGPVPVDTSVAKLDPRSIDLLVIPGGFAPDKLRQSDDVLRLVRELDAGGTPIAFICHAGWVPISAGIISGRRATSVAAIRDDMVNAGCEWSDEPTVIDANLISARHPGDLGPWLKAILAALEA